MLSSVGVYVSVTFDDHHGGRYIESAENSYRRTEGSPSPTGMGQEMRNRFKMWQADSVDGVRCVRMMCKFSLTSASKRYGNSNDYSYDP